MASLLARLEPFLSELAHLHYRHGAGLAPGLPLGELYQRYRELCSPESFAMVEEALTRRSLGEEERGRLQALRELVATLVEDALAQGAVEEIARLEGGSGIGDHQRALPLESDRGRRAFLEAEVCAVLTSHQPTYGRRREAAFAAARVLGKEDYLELRQRVTRIALGPLLEQAQAVLRSTEDAYRDVLGYALRKLDPTLRPLPHGDASWHDLLRLSTAPWLLEHFGRGDLLPAVRRAVEALGFHPSAHGRIQLDAEEREGKSKGPFVAEIRIPDEVRLVIRQGQGMEDAFTLLHEYGHALHFAHLPRHAAVEDRRLGDASVSEAYAFLFDHFLLEEQWHRRFLRMSAPQAREAARISAFNDLALLRRHAARLLYEVELYRRGPSSALAAEYRTQLEAALLVRIPKELYLYDLDPQLYGARYLRAWSLEVIVAQQMRERFDQDFFRNPAAGRWLQGLFERGRRVDAEALAQELGQAPLSLQAAGARLVAVLDR